MTGDLYVQSVIDHVPQALPLRDQIAMELLTNTPALVLGVVLLARP